MIRWELPEGWEWTSLAEVAKVTGGLMKGRKRGPDEVLRAVPYLRVANVQRGRLDLTEVKTIEATESEIAALKLEPGDILFNEGGDRDQLGRGCVWSGELPECIHQNHVFRARLRSPEVSAQLVSMWGNSFGQDYFIEAGSQTTNLASISLKNLAGLPIPLPPPAEQTRIVTRLNALQARIATARAGLDELRQLATALKRAVLDAAFRGELTAAWREAHPDAEPASTLLDRLRAERRRRWQEAHPKKPYLAPEPVDPTDLPELPEGWCWAALGEVLTDLRNGIATKPANETGQAILRISAVRPLALDIRDVRYLPLGTYESFQLADGDLLFTRYNGNADLVGACAVVRGVSSSLVYPDKLIRGRLDEVDPEFIAAMVAGGPSRAYLDSRARSAAGQVGISGNDIRLTPVPLAPLAEQRRIAAIVTSTWSTTAHALEVAQALSDDLTTTERALLTAAFRGELLPPASCA